MTEGVIDLYDLLYDKNTISEDELRSKILEMFDYTDNTARMLEYFLKIIRTQKGNYMNIKACFKTMVEYCKGENYYDQMCDCIAMRIDVDSLEIEDHVKSIFDLFKQ